MHQRSASRGRCDKKTETFVSVFKPNATTKAPTTTFSRTTEKPSITTIESAPKQMLELRGGQDNREGNVFLNGLPVCDDNWGHKHARVVCR